MSRLPKKIRKGVHIKLLHKGLGRSTKIYVYSGLLRKKKFEVDNRIVQALHETIVLDIDEKEWLSRKDVKSFLERCLKIPLDKSDRSFLEEIYRLSS